MARPADFRPVLLALLTMIAAPAVAGDAAPLPPAMPPGTESLGTATVAGVIDGETMLLGDGRMVRLAGVDLPDLDRAGAGGRSRHGDPGATPAAAALAELVSNKSVELRSAGNPSDRHGRVVAHVIVDGQWVETALLARGLARVHSLADNRAGIADMLAVEDGARRAAIGLWAGRAYAVRPADEAARYAGSFQIVDGTVVDTALVDGQVYVHFGADWHNSFSLRAAGTARRLCRAAGFDPLALAKRHIRVRGFVDGVTRPVMEVTHPEQIEFL